MHRHRSQFVLHRGAIGAVIRVGVAEHAAVHGMQNIKLHAGRQRDAGRDQAQSVGFLVAGRLDVGDASTVQRRANS